MREIKFRVWDTENKEMLRVQELDFEDTFYGGRLSIRTEQYNDYFDIEDMILMQYTGLYDKNGKEIYEGDIVRIPNDYELYGTNAGEAYEVYFAYGGFRLKPKYNSKARGYWLEDDNEIEIIGNIYESKELLNETN